MRRLLLLALPLAACSAQPVERPPDAGYTDGNAGNDAAAAVQDKFDAARAEADARNATAEDTSPTILSLTITPEEPHIDSVLTAVYELNPKASQFTDVDFTWTVNGDEIRSVTRDSVSIEQLGAKKKDLIQVSATAIDETGRSSTLKSSKHHVLNSTPEITSNIRNASGLNGVRFTAEDPDGDELKWEVRSGPPGVTIDRNGRVRVEIGNLTEAFNGELVIAAVDPDGAAAEAHIPVNVSAATEATTEKTTVKRGENRFSADMEELEGAQERALDAIEKMSAEEFDKYVREQEEREQMPDPNQR